MRREDRRLPDGLVMVEMPSRSDEDDAVLVTLERSTTTDASWASKASWRNPTTSST